MGQTLVDLGPTKLPKTQSLSLRSLHSVLWVELCRLPPKDAKVLLVPQNVILFGNTVVADVLVKMRSY